MGSEDFLVARIDRAGLITAANALLCARRGAESGELLGTGLQYLVNAGERDAFTARVRGVFTGHESGSVLARLLTVNGECAPTILWTLVPLPSSSGEVESALGIGMDLSAYLDVPPLAASAVVAPADGEELEALREEVKGLRSANRRMEKEIRSLHEAPTAPPPPVPAGLRDEEDAPPTLAELERRHIFHTLQATKGRVSGKKGAAGILGIHPNTLRSRMEKLGITKVG